jgi:NAD(P)-dependent dehydrogenase (short-subunit alcohol dehydrogenase family)
MKIVRVSAIPMSAPVPKETGGYSGARAYCQSKLAQIMFTIDLAAALQGTGVTVTCLHPATYMDTSMVRRAGVTPLSTVEEGARAILNLATSPAVAGRTGLYFNGLRGRAPHLKRRATVLSRQGSHILRAKASQLKA